MEKLANFDRERIPERVVHARGASAKGFFEVRVCGGGCVGVSGWGGGNMWWCVMLWERAGWLAGFGEGLSALPPHRRAAPTGARMR